MADSKRKTANLFDLSAHYAVDSGISNIETTSDSITYNASSVYLAIRYKFNLSASDVFVIGLGNDSDKVQLELRYLKNNVQVGQMIVIQKGSYKIIRGGDAYDAFSIYISNGTNTGTCKASNIMLNTGSTPLPYEPYGWVHSLRKLTTSTDTITTLPVDIYADGNNATVGLKGNTIQNGTGTPDNPIMPQGCGDLETVGAKAGQYKIPISSANTTTPIYLGEVQTTRRVKKYEFKGTEHAALYSLKTQQAINIQIPDSNIPADPTANALIVGISDRYTPYTRNALWGKDADGFSYSNSANTIVLSDSRYQTVDSFKTYLADQYAAGTPVTVWYVLATPTTGIVNEPLMKIGDYADTVSGITIPTITGKDTFDVETTLKPSEASLSYTGWHDATVEEWDGSDWQ